MTRPVLRIRTDRFLANIAAVRARIAPSDLMIVVKDQSYGHGLAWAVDAAVRAGVTSFGSYDIRSGVEIRTLLGDTAHEEVRIFAWATSTDEEIDAALEHRIDLGVGTAEYLDRVLARAAERGILARIHLKIDTGLHRNGLLPSEWPDTIRRVRAAEAAGHAALIGIWSHLAEASDAEDDDARAVFLSAIRIAEQSGPTPEALHLTASAASWWRPELRGSVSRIGAFCYGIRSADGPDLDGILPIAELIAPVVDVAGGEALIGIGSFDGLPSSLAGASVGTPAGPRGIRRVGEASTAVEGWDGMAVGDEVRVFGAGESGESSATTLAERIDTVGEEILTRLTPFVRRVIVD
ncbi:alanine racemase [Microbacterium sp. NPDC089696]|uniref:alanine racemase n=1 Tax=Microbacterium sp. NPDC089696 TaxID=3364199 RepID=UPI003822DFC3